MPFPTRAGLITVALSIIWAPLAAAQDRIPDAPSGREAIEILGERLAEVAVRHDLKESKLRSLLLEDESLRVTPSGDLFYVCPKAPDPAPGEKAVEPDKAAPFDLAETFLLHSNPGADHVLYLDFDGHETTDPAWTQYNKFETIVSAPYDIDQQPQTFSAAEREFIQLTWQIVAEDMLPFDIDVTTEEPPLDRLQNSGAGTIYGECAL